MAPGILSSMTDLRIPRQTDDYTTSAIEGRQRFVRERTESPAQHIHVPGDLRGVHRGAHPLRSLTAAFGNGAGGTQPGAARLGGQRLSRRGAFRRRCF